MSHRVEETSQIFSMTPSESPAEVEAVRSAIAAGDLVGFQEVFSECLEGDSKNRLNKDNFICGLTDAIEAGQPSDWLLLIGFSFNCLLNIRTEVVRHRLVERPTRAYYP